MERTEIVRKVLDNFFEGCRAKKFCDIPDEYIEYVRRATTLEIKEALSDMVTLTAEEIANYMLEKGYSCERFTDKFAWVILDEDGTLRNSF